MSSRSEWLSRQKRNATKLLLGWVEENPNQMSENVLPRHDSRHRTLSTPSIDVDGHDSIAWPDILTAKDLV